MDKVDDMQKELRQILQAAFTEGDPIPVLEPRFLNLAARLMLEAMRPARPDRVGGSASGTEVLIGAVTALSSDVDWPMSGFVIRDGPVWQGEDPVIEGAPLGLENRLAILTTFATDGKNEARLVDRLRERNLRMNIVGVYALIESGEGARQHLRSVGVPLHALLSGDDLPEVSRPEWLRQSLPDMHDGLKPPQRGILLAVHELTGDNKYHKSNKILEHYCRRYREPDEGRAYHTMVRLAREDTIRYRLLEPLGNFGTVHGYSPADAIYTECGVSSFGRAMLADTNPGTVPYQTTPDGKDAEPEYLAASLPLFILNGAGGEAFGEQNSVPPHNLGEVCRCLMALLYNPELSLDELLRHIPGPDFPFGGIIYQQRYQMRRMYEQGASSCTVYPRCTLETTPKGRTLIFTEIPNSRPLEELVLNAVQDVSNGRVKGVIEVYDLTSSKTELAWVLP